MRRRAPITNTSTFEIWCATPTCSARLAIDIADTDNRTMAEIYAAAIHDGRWRLIDENGMLRAYCRHCTR